MNEKALPVHATAQRTSLLRAWASALFPNRAATPAGKLAIRGAVWILVGYTASLVLRFGSNLILTRLLFPELFGLMALVNSLMIGLGFFSDFGVGPSIIQNPRGDDPAFLNTAWSLQVARGFGLSLISLLIAWPVARVYGDDRLFWLIPVVGLSALIDGFNSTSLFTLVRRIQVARLTVLDLGVQALTAVLTVTWALLSPTVWTLVAANLGAALVRLWWSHRINPGPPNRFMREPQAFREIMAFGKWVFVSTAMTFLGLQSDRLLLGKLVSLQLLGVYAIAFALSDIPRSLMIKLSSTILFPLISQQAHLPRSQLRNTILRRRKLILFVSGVLLALLISSGDVIVSKLYDARYAEAQWMFPLLALGLWQTLLYNTMTPVLMGIGQTRYVAHSNTATVLAMIGGVPLGFFFGGIVGAVLAVAFSDLPKYFVLAYGLERERLGTARQDAQLTLAFIATLAVCLSARLISGYGLPFAKI